MNCFSSLWTYLNSSAADCPLSYAGFTVYATIDVGLGYSSNGAPASGTYSNSVYSFVGKQSYGPKWLWTPNGISQSVVGINMKEAIPWLPGWSLVGALETGFNPYTGNLVNGPRSLVQNNGLPLVLQSANSDSSRAGQFDNSVGYLGLSNQDFRNAHRRPRDLADARRRHRLRSDGRLLRVLSAWLFWLLCGLRRHGNQPRQHRSEVPSGL